MDYFAMKPITRRPLVWAAALLPVAGVGAGAGAYMSKTDQPRPVLRAGIGMSVEEVQAGSTLSLDGIPPRRKDEHIQSMKITKPFDLVIVDPKGGEVRINELALEPKEWALVTFDDGKLWTIDATIQFGRYNLRDTVSQIKELHALLSKKGYIEDSRWRKFGVSKKLGEGSEPRISGFDELEALWLDTEARVYQMGLPTMIKGNMQVGFSLTHSRRMRANQDARYDDESNIKTEKQFLVHVSIMRVIDLPSRQKR
jgi:hypothetical protein